MGELKYNLYQQLSNATIWVDQCIITWGFTDGIIRMLWPPHILSLTCAQLYSSSSWILSRSEVPMEAAFWLWTIFSSSAHSGCRWARVRVSPSGSGGGAMITESSWDTPNDTHAVQQRESSISYLLLHYENKPATGIHSGIQAIFFFTKPPYTGQISPCLNTT